MKLRLVWARIAAVFAAVLVMLFSATAAQALTCTVTASASRNDADTQGSQKIAHLRVPGTSEVDILNSAGGVSSGPAPLGSPGRACQGTSGSAGTNQNRQAGVRFTGTGADAHGVQSIGGGAEFTITYAKGVLRGTAGGTWYFDPSATGDQNLTANNVTIRLTVTNGSYQANTTYTGNVEIIQFAGAPSAATIQDFYDITVTIPSPPAITSLVPDNTVAGTSASVPTVAVSIGGTGFSTAGNTVTFTDPGGGTAATITGVASPSETSLTVNAPKFAVAGASTVTVTNAEGQVSNGATFRYLPTVTAVAPMSSAAGATNANVQISGTGYASGMTVKVGTTSATNVTLNSPTQVTATFPALAAGTYDVTVTVNGGTSSTASSPDYTYNAPITNAVAVGTSPINPGGTSQLTFTLTNPSGNATLGGVTSNTIALPANVVVAATPNTSTTGCGGATFAPAAGATSFSLTGGVLAAGVSTCTFSVAVTSNVPGSYAIPTGIATSSTSAAGVAGTNGTLVVLTPTTLGVAMTHSGNAAQGGTLTYTVTPSVTGSPTSTATLTATFALPSGMTYVSASGTNWSCSGSGQSGSCTTTTGFAVGNGPAITLNTAFAANATTPLVPSVQLAGGGGTNTPTATDSTVVTQTPAAVAVTAGNNQSAAINTAFATPLSVTVRDANNAVISGVPVTFTAPASGASGRFSNSTNTITVNTNGSGVAAAGTFTANATTGGPYSVATTAGSTTASFSLTNTASATSVTLSSGTNPSAFGASVVFTVRATDPNGGGSVQLKDNGSNAGSAASVTSDVDQTITLSGLSVGTHSITAVYTPTSSSSTGATSAVVAQVVNKASQTITFANPGSQSLSASPVTLAATSSSGLTVAFTSATTGVCTVSGTSLTLVATGTCTVNANQAGDGNYNAASQVQQSFQVTPVTLTITPGAASGTTVGASYSQANPAAGGTAPYNYTLASGALPAGTSLNTGTGDVTGTPTTAGAFSYAIKVTDSQGTPVSATGATVLGTIAKANQTITFANPGSQSLSASPVTLSATSSSGLTIAFTSATTGVCTVSGTSLTLLTTGTCTVNANQAGDGNYNAASQVQQSFQVTPATLTITPGAASGTTVGASYSQANPAAGGTAPYTYALDSGAVPVGTTLDASTGTVSGTPTTAGAYGYAIKVTDSQGTPVSATGTTVSGTIAKGSQTITFAPLADASLSASPLTLGATASSGLTVAYNSSTTAVCTVSGTSLTLLTTGTCTVSADQAGNANYNAAGTVTRSFTVTPAALAVTPAPASGTTVGASYSQANPASGGTAPYTYALASGTLPTGTSLNTGNGTVSGTPTAAGNFSYAIKATDSQGTPASTTGATVSVTIAKANQTITFANPGSQSLSASPVTLSATSSSGLTVAFTSATTGVCTVSGTSLTLLTTGTCTVNANQAGDGNTNAASQVQQSFQVTPATLTITPGAASGTTVGGSYSQANPAAGGTAPYTYAIASGALPAGTSLNTGSGDVTGTPTAAGGYSYAVKVTDSQGTPVSATGTTVSGTIAKGSQTITFTSTAPGNAQVGGATYTVTATASSNLPVTLAIAPGSSAVCSLSGSTVSFTAAGTCAITADQADNANYNAAPQVQQSVAVAMAAPVVTGLSPNSGPASGGTQVTITGSDLTGATGVSFGGTAAASFSVVGATSINAVAPAGTAGTLDVRVTTAGGTSATAAADRFTYIGAPVAGARSAAVPYNTATAIDLSGSVSGTHTSIAVTTAPAHGTTSVAGDTVTYTPASGYYGADSFAYAATGPGGTSAPATVSLTVATPAAPTAGAASANVPYDTATAIDLSTKVSGTHNSIVVTTAPAHGTTSIAGDTVTYTPASGYYGADSFAYIATGPGGTSAPATVSLTVATPAAPTTAAASANVAYNTATAIDLSGKISGVHSGVAVSTAPAHGTTSVAGDVVTYTPTAGYAGADSFAYTATGPGGTSAPATVTLTVASPALAITPTSLPAGQQDSAYSVTLSATGGTAPYRFAVTGGALPTGLTLSVGGTLAGTPGANGSFSFTVTATDSSTGTPASASQAYTLTIAVPPPPATRDTTVTANQSVTGGRPVTIDLSSLVSGDVTDIRIGSQPQHGTVTINTSSASSAQAIRPAASGTRYTATYVPAAGYQGPDRFTFIASGPGGTAEGTVNITVTGTAPTAASLTVTTGQNQSVTVDVSSASTGGPLTQAMIVGVSPAGSASASLIEGGTATARTYRLQIVPSARFTGTAVVTYTVGNANGMSAPATVTVTVTARPDPSSDPTVRGLVDAEAAVTRDFARTQLDNFGRRNESLHGGGGASNPTGMSVSSPLLPTLGAGRPRGGSLSRDMGPEAELKLEHATAVRGAELASTAVGSLPGPRGEGYAVTRPGAAMATAPGGGVAAAGDTTADSTGAGAGDGRKLGSVALWSGGAVTIGSRDATTRRAKLDIASQGLSAGADVKLGDSLVVGIGGGVGHERVKIGANNAGRLTADNWVGAFYGSLTPIDGAFVDVVAGYGEVDMKTRRDVTGGATALGSRDGTMTFASLSGGIDRSAGALRYLAYGRFEYLGATLDRYTESGGGPYSLVFDRRRLESYTGVAGGRVAMALGGVVPRARIEWRHEFNGTADQRLDYADLGGPYTYRLTGNGWTRDEVQGEVGIGVELGRGWSGGLDLGGRFGQGARTGTIRATISGKF